MNLSKVDFNDSLPAPPAGYRNVSWSSDISSHLAARVPIGGLGVSAGTSSTSLSSLVFSNSNGISFGLSNSTITASVLAGAAIKVSAGTLSDTRSDVTFSNSNGVTFGLETNGVITASVSTNYQSQGAYLTTAARSQDSSKYAGTNGAITGGSITVNTSGVSVNLPAYLTTAMQSNAATISNVKISAGTLSSNRSDVTFADSNGISFGLNTDGNLTATVATNYQSAGAYLTTAALSQDSSKYAGTSTGITGGSVTLNTSGIAINLPAYLTTAMQSNAATISNIKLSAGTLSNNLSAVTFSDSNGISWGLNTNSVLTATVKTDYQASGAYLTTAALSQDSSKYAGTSTGITGGSVTLNTSGIAINLPAYLTTADLSANSSNYVAAWDILGANTAGTTSSAQGTKLHFSAANSLTLSGSSNTIIFSVGAYLTTAALSADSSKYAGTSTGITGGSVTLNTSGIAINLPAYLTTAALSADSSKYAGTSTGMTGGSITLNTSGIAINLPAYLTTADLSANSSAYLQRWDLLGANTAGTTTSASLSRLQLSAESGLTLSGNSNTIRISIGAYLTTAALSADSSKYAGTSTGITGGSVTLNTSGIAINLPAYLTTARASTDAIGLNTAQTNVTWTVNSSGLSINAAGYAGTVSGATNCSVTVNTSGVSVSVNPGATVREYNPPWVYSGMNTTSSLGQNTQYFQPFDLDQFLSAGYIAFYISHSIALSAGNSTGTCAVGAGYALYTRDMTNGAGSNTLSLLTSYNMTIISMSMTSNTAFRATHFIGTSGNSSHSTSQYAVSNASVTNYVSTTLCGLRPVYFPISSLMTPGRYWLGFWVSTVSGNAMTNNVSVLATTVSGAFPAMMPWGAASTATNASFYMQAQGWGSFSAVQSTWPNSIAWTSDTIRQGASGTLIPFRIAGYNTNASQI